MVVLAWGEGSLDIILNKIQDMLEVNEIATKQCPKFKIQYV